MKLRASLVRRTAALSTVSALLLLVAGALALGVLYRSSVLRDVDSRLDQTLRVLLVALQLGPDGRAVLGDPDLIGVYDQALSGWYWKVVRVDEVGDVSEIGRSRSFFEDNVSLDAAYRTRLGSEPGTIRTTRVRGPVNEPLRMRGQLVFLEDNQDAYILVAATDRRPIQRDVRRFAWAASWTLVLFALLLGAAVLLQVRWGLAPVFRMRDAVADVRSGERTRMSEDAPAELAPLAIEINALLDHNRDVVERARAHVGNLAHALKTPISVLLNESRAAEGPFADVVLRQVEVMAQQVGHHLKHASAAARAQSVGARADVASVMDDLARTMPRMHSERAIELEVRGHAGLTFRGERQDLVEMVGNLLDNAFKWARGRVTFVAEPQTANGRLVITVADDGPGLPQEKREEVLRRGARLDEATPGSGLGLSIVDDLARAYGGRLVLGESDMGGLQAVLELPAFRPT